MQRSLGNQILKRVVALILIAAFTLVALPRVAAAAGDVGVGVASAYDSSGVNVNEPGVAAYVPAAGSSSHFSIIATPKSGFVFDYWEAKSTNGGYTGTFFGSQLTLPFPATGKTMFIAHFVNTSVKARFGIYTQVYGSHADRGTVTGRAEVADEKTLATATITAMPNPGYVFDYWELNDGNVKFYERSMSVSVRNKKHIYTAYFKAEAAATGAIVEGGCYVNGNNQTETDIGRFDASTWKTDTGGTATGTMLYSSAAGAGQTATLQAYARTAGYVFAGWVRCKPDGTLRERVYYSYSPVITVPVTNERILYRAVFIEENLAGGVFVGQTVLREGDTVTYGIGGTATGAMLYNPNGGLTQQTTLQAFPSSDSYVFSYWATEDTTKPAGTIARHPLLSTANPYTLEVPQERLTVYPVFVRTTDAMGVFTSARLEPAGGLGVEPGTTTGDKLYNPNGGAGQQTAMQAFPKNDMYVFSHWELGGNRISSANPYTVKVENRRDEYVAVFIATPDNTPVPITPKPTGIADAKNFKDVWRKVTDPIYRFTRDSLAGLASEVVESVRSRYASVDPTVGESAAVARLQEQLQEKDLPKDRSEMSKLPEDVLVSSEGARFNTDGISTGDYVDIANDTVEKRFGGLYDYEILQVVRVTGSAGAGDKELTMVWKNTGAAYRDRLLLLQFLPDGAQNAATPVADEDGTLTFTLPAAVDSDYMLLRVFIMQNTK